MKRKKSSLFFMPLVVFFTFIALVNLYIVLLNKSSFYEPIGQKQFALLKVYTKAEAALFYIDQSAKYALQQAVYDLAKNGGYSEKSGCGYYLGANIWQSETQNCYPDNKLLKDAAIKTFSAKITDYLVEYPDALIPAYYDYELSGNLQVKGVAKEELKLDIIPDKFVFKPSIKSTNPSEIYTQSQQQQPQLLSEPAKKGVDIETIKKYHPEVLVQYAELCKRIGAEPSGVCGSTRKKCCITDGYRHPAQNEKEGGARNSAHQYGLALDIYIGPLTDQLKAAKANEPDERRPKLFARVGVYPGDTHIHADLMPLRGSYAVPFFVAKGGQTLATANSLAELESKARVT